MPETDGFEFVRQMKESWPIYPSRTIMLSSVSTQGDALRCNSLGINRHILKPAKAQELYRAICEMRSPLVSEAPRQSGPYFRAGNGPEAGSLRLKILLAEDNIINQRVAQRVLEKAGHSVVVVDNGKLALEALDRQTFDLVLMDVQMPEMDGFEATEAIREREEWSVQRMPIIALTAHAMSGDRERCLAHGMDAYVQKPIDSADLFSSIDRLFNSNGRTQV